MRCFILSLFLCASGVFAGEPSEVALRFLQGAQSAQSAEATDETAKIIEGLAISSFCGPEKRQLIHERWQGRTEWLKSAKYELSSLTEKVDQDLAAVLIAARTEESPEATAVIALALVNDGLGWKVAPIEGRFSNAGLGFSSEMKERVDALERWMEITKIKARTDLLQGEWDRFCKSIEGAVDPEKLKIEDPEEALVEFLKAAHAGETEKLLVWQGVLERDQLPERNWGRHIQATRLGMMTRDPQSAWGTLRSNKVMKVIVNGHGDTEEAAYLVACLSSFKVNPRSDVLNAIRFELLMTKEGWRIQLPVFYSYDSEDLALHKEIFNDRGFDHGDVRDAKEMGYVFELENDSIRVAEPKAMLEGVVTDLEAGALVPFLQRHFREVEEFQDDDDDDGEDDDDDALPARQAAGNGDIDARRMERYRAAIRWWGAALGPHEVIKAGIQKIYLEGDLALGIIKLETGGTGWKPHFKRVWMEQAVDGWMILPGDSEPLTHSITSALIKNQKKLLKAYSTDQEEFEKEYSLEVLKSFGRDDPTGEALDEAGALKLVTKWRAAASEGSMMDLVRQSAVRAIPADTAKFMRDLGYHRTSAAVWQGGSRLLGSRAFGRFRGVTLEVEITPGKAPLFPLNIVVPTKDGHQILTDIEFILESNKGYRLMNEARIEALGKELSQADLASIVALRQWHQALALPLWEKWNIDQAQKQK